MSNDFGRMAKRFRKFRRRLPDAHADATEESMDDLKTEVGDQIRANDSVAREVLIHDVTNRPRPTPHWVSRSVSTPGWSKYLEHGTGERGGGTMWDDRRYPAPSPGPPDDDIRKWVVSKPVTSSRYDESGLVKAIQDTIAAVGTFAYPFMRPAWHSARGYQHIIDANVNALRRELRRL